MNMFGLREMKVTAISSARHIACNLQAEMSKETARWGAVQTRGRGSTHTIELSLSKREERDEARDLVRERALLSQAWSLVSVIPALTVLGGRIPSSRQAWVMQQDTVSKIDIQKPCQLGWGEEISDGYDSEDEDAMKKQQGAVTDNGGWYKYDEYRP